jgi:hypothetical protein
MSLAMALGYSLQACVCVSLQLLRSKQRHTVVRGSRESYSVDLFLESLLQGPVRIVAWVQSIVCRRQMFTWKIEWVQRTVVTPRKFIPVRPWQTALVQTSGTSSGAHCDRGTWAGADTCVRAEKLVLIDDPACQTTVISSMGWHEHTPSGEVQKICRDT